MRIALKVVNGAHVGKQITLTKQTFLIGRSEDCHLRPASDVISRHHCALIVDGGYVGLRDFGSKNGTYVNGERVSGECELNAGDTVKVGPLQFEIVIEHRVGGERRPAVRGIEDVAARTAASGQNEDEEDISQWLTTAEDATSPTRDTQPLKRMDDTGRIELPAQSAASSDAPPPEPREQQAAARNDQAHPPANAPHAAPTVPQQKKASAAPPPPEAHPPAQQPASEKRRDNKVPKTEPGKLPRLPSSQGKDSSDAAADILRKLSRRR
ncbi:MAG: FHA domain-containing protein [Pirellulales bacterium]